jgi:hypothetical protein
MACNNCNETQDPNCGCTTEALHINQICNPIVCPSDECAESFSAACIRYTGDDLVCDNVTVVEADTNISQALSNIVAFICADTTGTDTVVAAGNNIIVGSNTVGNTTTYTVTGKETIVAAGENVTVTSVTVGNDTTYTVNAACPMTVRIGAGIVARTIQATVTGGLAPYTYAWEMADFIGGTVQSMWTLSASITPNVVEPIINPAIVNKFDACNAPNTGTIGLAKVIVTDANGCIAQDTFLLIDIACI